MAARGLSGRKVVTAFANSRGVNVPTTAAFKHQDKVDKPECGGHSRALCTSVQSPQTPTESSWRDSQDPMDAQTESLIRETVILQALAGNSSENHEVPPISHGTPVR